MGFRPVGEEGAGPFQFFSYNEIQLRVDRYGSGLVNLELASLDEENGMRRIGHYSKNRLEWVIAEQVCHIRYLGYPFPVFVGMQCLLSRGSAFV